MTSLFKRLVRRIRQLKSSPEACTIYLGVTAEQRREQIVAIRTMIDEAAKHDHRPFSALIVLDNADDETAHVIASRGPNWQTLIAAIGKIEIDIISHIAKARENSRLN